MEDFRKPKWGEPEIEDWDDDEDLSEEEDWRQEDRQVILGLGFGGFGGFGCYPRRFCFPRQFGCYPRQFGCRPRLFGCYPRQFSCYPRRNCYPRPCYPI
ncbi:hypothetical protein [Dendrosporobacter sp. 1207_IL3150]|uniref:hypothetical protein n=1 Tax=Dendrosporobacter sp. 1207_IL3150 TaxID=3084054 RepID=UPI002FDA648F